MQADDPAANGSADNLRDACGDAGIDCPLIAGVTGSLTRVVASSSPRAENGGEGLLERRRKLVFESELTHGRPCENSRRR